MENNFDKENEQLEPAIESNESPIEDSPIAEAPIEEAGVEETLVEEENSVYADGETNIDSVSDDTELALTATKKPFAWWIVGVAGVVLASIIALVLVLMPKNADYTVTVVDEIGNPISNVMVKLTDGTGETKTRVTDKNGKAVFLEARVSKDNVVKLDKGLSNVKLLTSEYHLDRKTTTLRAIVCNQDDILDIYSQNIELEGLYAYNAKEATYNIPSLDGTVYLNFMASGKGVYKVSIDSDDATVAYVGMPSYIQSTHIGDGEYDGKSFEIIIQDPNTPYVFAVSATSGADVALTIEFADEAPLDPQYLPWTNVEATEEFIEVNTGTLKPLDIANANLSLELRNGYYYTAGNKLVYVRIASTSEYLDASLALMAGCIDDKIGVNIGGYVYDGDTFVGKYSYNDMIEAYYEHCDANGVYPLTEELAEAIKLHGENAGWWNNTSAAFLFNGKPYRAENAWLFLCCTE